MADISSIKLPSGTSYNIKDSTVRSTISTLSTKSTYIYSSVSKDNISLGNATDDSEPSTSTTISVSKSGYTAIGILSWVLANAGTNGVNSSYARIITAYLSNSTTATVRIASSARTNGTKVKVTLHILYKAN